jgi:hypothetical protein
MENTKDNSKEIIEKKTKKEFNPLTPEKIEEYVNKQNPYVNFKKFIMDFKPKVLSINEFNPIHKPEYSLPVMGLSFALLAYYKRRYYLINNFSFALNSLLINYYCYYYLLVNAVEFHHYVNSKSVNFHLIEQTNKLN